MTLIIPRQGPMSEMAIFQHPSYSSLRAASDVQAEVVDWHPCRIGRGCGGEDADSNA
jgi:hypothetical protein